MIRLLVADDHEVLRLALCEMLEKRGKYEILAQASNGEELLRLIDQHKPDMVIMDVQMPRLDGVQTLQQLQEKSLSIPVLVLSADDGKRNVKNVLRSGAKGFLPKNAGVEELEFAIESILQGRTYLSPSITGHLMEGGEETSESENPLSILTKREIEILKYLADGLPNRQIGKLLHISTRTVDTHRSNILRKLNLNTNAELVKLAIAQGLIFV
jgi:DNA-binding NarL/FixJ family response regulator